MPVCPSCEAANPDGNRFCGHCGTILGASPCASCGAPNPEGQPFCGQCGAAIDVASVKGLLPAIEERKLATILFADVVGFTSFAERTDPEVVARIVDAAFRQLAEVVAEHGGTVDKYMGDSMMAVFGVPVAHDDDAERAVAAGLAVRALGGDLTFSIGINSGEVMATSVGRAGEVTVIGDTVNVAARLEKVAAPGEVLCGRLTTELAGRGIWFRERQPVLLKGKQEPVGVWEAVALRPVDAEPAADGPQLVGRDDELAFLASQWRRVRRDRQPHVVLLCGEAGSGKTRLLNELALTAATGGRVIRATYPAYGTMGGSRVAAEVIRQLGPAHDREVDARLRSIAGELDPSLQAIDPAGMPQEQLWALARLVQEKGADEPLLLIIDDMHHSGDRTLEILGELAGRLHSVALLIVLAGRTEPGEWLTRFPAATTVRLGPLSRADAVTLAGAFVCDRPLAPEAADFLVDRASGNPLYLRELVAMARSRGSLVVDGDLYRLTAHAAIPATLQALLAARLDALEPGLKLGLQHVAVLGEAATVDQVSGLGSQEASATLRSLVDVGLLRHGPDGRYDTVDSLLREVAYETLPHNLRGELHRQAADMVATPEERARHLDRAATYLSDDETVAAEAVEALVVAGKALIQASRHLDALRLLERALALGCLPSSALLDLAKLQALSSRDQDALRTLAMIEDDPDDPAVAVERDHTSATSTMFSDPSSSIPGLHEAARRWRALGVTDKEAWARGNTGVAYFNLSRMEESAAELEHALKLFEQIDDRAGTIAVSSFLCLVKPTDPRVSTWLADALEFADASGDRSRQLNTLTTLAWNHFLRSFCGGPHDMAEAEGFARRLTQLADDLGARDQAVQGWSLLTIMARLSGRFEEAAEHAAALQKSTGNVPHRDPWLAWAASFAVTVAGGASDAAAPFPPETSRDPVVAMAELIIEAELTMAGRVEEALARVVRTPRPELGPIADVARVFHALALVLAGRGAEARPWVERAAAAARVLNAPTTAAAAAALWAEIMGDATGLPAPPGTAHSVTDVLVLRAYASRGDTEAMDALRDATKALAMPGLMIGV
ncbi:MAG TPA: adenylate/guanylate cyclase domain-containing protein [Acidimicrobiales bacterium]|nr:adenylate/guanylate cyclase domain-containing protein [Acidimicrobiales bacterium]